MTSRAERRAATNEDAPAAANEDPSAGKEPTFDCQRLLTENAELRLTERAAAERSYTAKETEHPSPSNAAMLREALMRADERHNAKRISIIAEDSYRRCLASLGSVP
jgi:hypothetical protein